MFPVFPAHTVFSQFCARSDTRCTGTYVFTAALVPARVLAAPLALVPPLMPPCLVFCVVMYGLASNSMMLDFFEWLADFFLEP